MNEREKILARIREALAVSAPVPGHDSAAAPEAAPPLPRRDDQQRVMPDVRNTAKEQLELFAHNAADLKATFLEVADAAAMQRELKVLSMTEQWTRVASHRGDLSRLAADSLGLPVMWVEAHPDKRDVGQCDVGISECDALVAQTGSVVVTSRSAGGRALSCLPPHHVVVATREQLVPDLPAAFAMLKSKYGSDFPSMISFITGPSRTGDIERILVLGAHGPRKLTILCLG